MGASLIGFLLVGPREFSQEQLENAKAIFEKEKERLFALLDEDKDPWDILGDDDCEAYYAILRSASADVFIEQLTAVWNGSGRDCCVRTWNDRTLIFGGEQTWGDTPEGYAYTALRAVVAIRGMDTALGVE